MLGKVEKIYIAAEAGAEMLCRDEVEAVAGRGLVGDRYLHGTGRFSRGTLVPVTLITLMRMAHRRRKTTEWNTIH